MPGFLKKTYSGSTSLATDELTYFTLNQSGQTVTLTYLDTSPYGVPYANTNCEGKDHTIATYTLPPGYVALPETMRGTSSGRGCSSYSFSRTDGSVTSCTAAVEQTVSIKYKFSACPAE